MCRGKQEKESLKNELKGLTKAYELVCEQSKEQQNKISLLNDDATDLMAEYDRIAKLYKRINHER